MLRQIINDKNGKTITYPDEIAERKMVCLRTIEVKESRRSLKRNQTITNGKSPGVDIISAEILKAKETELCNILWSGVTLLTLFLCTKRFPHRILQLQKIGAHFLCQQDFHPHSSYITEIAQEQFKLVSGRVRENKKYQRV